MAALAGAAISAGGFALLDLIINLLGRKGGRRATSQVVQQLLGKGAASTPARLRVGQAGKRAATFGAGFGALDLALQSIGGPEEQNAMASQHNLATVGKDNQIDAQLEQLLSHLLANSDQEPFL